jgi:hypothetical protein
VADEVTEEEEEEDDDVEEDSIVVEVPLVGTPIGPFSVVIDAAAEVAET